VFPWAGCREYLYFRISPGNERGWHASAVCREMSGRRALHCKRINLIKRGSMFSKACEYGIKAVLYIASQSLKGMRVKIGDIVKNIDSPEAFTGKILGVLSKNGIVDSYTGPNGGFEIKREKLHRITIAEVVRAIDGEVFFEGCALGLSECDESHPCPMHHSIANIRTNMRNVLQNTTVYELAVGLGNRESILMR
jgi:Rrf2 family protein